VTRFNEYMQAIKTMASYFGRVERITPFQYDESQLGVCRPAQLAALLIVLADLTKGPFGGSFTKAYPPPHDAPRSPVMDAGCWEVKWDFRDDCVSALMVRRHSTASFKPYSRDMYRRCEGCPT
jgi:hypothetical protein